MKKLIVYLLLAGFVISFLSACGGGGYGGGRAYFRSDYGYGAWRGYPEYIGRPPIDMPPPDPGFDRPEAVHLPEPGPPIDMPMPEAMPMEPMMDMDMGMPEIDIGGF